jgi:hypothetical protein
LFMLGMLSIPMGAGKVAVEPRHRRSTARSWHSHLRSCRTAAESAG